MIKAVFFDLDGTLLDRDASIEQFITITNLCKCDRMGYKFIDILSDCRQISIVKSGRITTPGSVGAGLC